MYIILYIYNYYTCCESTTFQEAQQTAAMPAHSTEAQSKA